MKTAVLLGILTVVAAQAQDCDLTVAERGGHFIQDGALSGSVDALKSRGADPFVRVIAKMQTTTFAGEESAWERNCPSWQMLNGDRKNNLIVVVVSVGDRKTGIYYGSQWAAALGAKWPSVEGTMAPHFKRGDYAAGLDVGLREIEKLITAHGAETPWLLIGCIAGGMAFVVIWIVIRASRKSAEANRAIRIHEQIRMPAEPLGAPRHTAVNHYHADNSNPMMDALLIDHMIHHQDSTPAPSSWSSSPSAAESSLSYDSSSSDSSGGGGDFGGGGDSSW